MKCKIEDNSGLPLAQFPVSEKSRMGWPSYIDRVGLKPYLKTSSKQLFILNMIKFPKTKRVAKKEQKFLVLSREN